MNEKMNKFLMDWLIDIDLGVHMFAASCGEVTACVGKKLFYWVYS